MNQYHSIHLHGQACLLYVLLLLSHILADESPHAGQSHTCHMLLNKVAFADAGAQQTSFGSVKEAVAAAQDGDQVVLLPGTHNGMG